MTDKPSILIYGYGNPGRQDDGLGNAFIDLMEAWLKENKMEQVELDSNYQLNIEDADAIKDKDFVLFVDASEEDIEDFILTRVEASGAQVEFTMHAVSTAFILNLCNQLYQKDPVTYLLHIKGHEWEFQEGLSPKAKANLDKAFKFITDKIQDPELLKEHVVQDF